MTTKTRYELNVARPRKHNRQSVLMHYCRVAVFDGAVLADARAVAIDLRKAMPDAAIDVVEVTTTTATVEHA